MKKIISLFMRNHDGDRLVRDEVTPGAEWVINGEGLATRKWDGTCCMVRDGLLFKRFEVKPGKTPPRDFEPACDVDPVTGKQQGWVPVGDGPEDKWHREAFDVGYAFCDVVDGTPKMQIFLCNGKTYELCGPRVNGNPENISRHILIRHGILAYHFAPRTFAGLRDWLEHTDIEGVVWHHPDGRMVKIKAKDFGLDRMETKKYLKGLILREG